MTDTTDVIEEIATGLYWMVDGIREDLVRTIAGVESAREWPFDTEYARAVAGTTLEAILGNVDRRISAFITEYEHALRPLFLSRTPDETAASRFQG